MSEVIWKKFVLNETFLRNTPPTTNLAAKELNISDTPFDGSVALITRAETNNGIRGYIEKGSFSTLKNKITYNDQFSFFLYHDYEFTTIKDHLSVINAKESKLQELLDANSFINGFIVTILNHVFSKEIFSFNFTGADYRYDREIILLPCLEVAGGDEFIWEENGKHYTLAVDYINKLMDEAKELREQKTIKLYEAERAKYEAERAKYEAERAKYEAEYKKEKDRVVWRGYKLGEFLEYSSKHVIKDQIKNLHIYNEKYEGTVANVTASKENNGIVGYIEETEEIKNKKVKNILTIAPDAAYAGVCFYQPDYVVSTGHNKMIEIILESLKEIFDKNNYLYLFLASLITKNFCKTFYGFSKSINDGDFEKTPVLLPCLEVADGDEFIWEENGKHYTLAVNYISYLYLTGRMNYNQKLIDNYSYQY